MPQEKDSKKRRGLFTLIAVVQSGYHAACVLSLLILEATLGPFGDTKYEFCGLIRAMCRGGWN